MNFDLNNPELKELIDIINKKRAIIITGAGITNATVNDEIRPAIGTWFSLLRHGIQFCYNHCEKSEEWQNEMETILLNAKSTVDDYLKIGDEIWNCLTEKGKIEDWLSIFDKAEPENRELVQAIRFLDLPVATSNYDNLLEDILLLTPITPLDTRRVEKFLDPHEKRKYVLHLHGYYKESSSIVFGKSSYDKIVESQFAQFINQYVATYYKALIFVGFGNGLYDQNFSLIFKWVAKYLEKTRIYHFVLDKDVKATIQIHKAYNSKNVIVIGYGNKYSDLADYLKNLAFNIERKNDLPRLLAGKPICIGREKEIEDIVNTILSENKNPVGIIGTVGLGKTNLLLNVLHHQKINRKYLKNRFFIRCDGIINVDLLINEIATSMGLVINGQIDMVNFLLNNLKNIEDPKLIALDNFETILEKDQNVLQFVDQLKDYSNLIFTLRATSAHPDLNWHSISLQHLSEEEGIKLFNFYSDNKFINNRLITHLVNELDNLPLAVELIAKRSRSVSDLEVIKLEWEKKKNEFLKIKGRENIKNYNLELSISFSYDSIRLNDEDRKFFKAIAYLPIGIPRKYLNEIFEDSFDKLASLKYTGLCEESLNGRIFLLNTIREYANNKELNVTSEIEKLQIYYLDLAGTTAEKVGVTETSAILLQTEWSNINKILHDSITTIRGVVATQKLVTFCQFTGLDIYDLLKRSIEIAKENNWTLIEGNNTRSLGDLEYKRSHNDEARLSYEKALKLYESINHLIGQANCLLSLGILFSRNSNSKGYYQKALLLYKQCEDLLGQANCLRRLGDIEFFQSNNKEAQKYYEESLTLAEDSGDNVGIATCLRCLGDLSESESLHEKAIIFYEKAKMLYEVISDLGGKANSLLALGKLFLKIGLNIKAEDSLKEALVIYETTHELHNKAHALKTLGDLSFTKGNRKEAKKYYEMALKIFENNSSLMGEASCLLNLGQVLFNEDKNDEALITYNAALSIYEKLNNVVGIANCYTCIGKLYFNQKELDKSKEFFFKALNIYQHINDLYSTGLVYLEMGNLFFGIQKLIEAKHFLCLAKKVWSEAKLDNLIKEKRLNLIPC